MADLRTKPDNFLVIKRALVFSVIILSTFLLLASSGLLAEKKKVALLLSLKGAIGPASISYFQQGLEVSNKQQPLLIIVEIDTPGGLDSAMREIVQGILASPVPVVSFVAPSGARAASAGTYIMFASHIAVMAPGTNLGAATPIQIGSQNPFFPGQSEKSPKEGVEDETGKQRTSKPTASDKAINDAVAYIRGLAQMRGRNVEWAEKAVREAKSLSASEALKLGVIDLIANDIDDLLAKIDGWEVTIRGVTHRLETSNLVLNSILPDWRSKILGIITNPNIAYILLLIGIYGLILEFYSPGLIGPGVIGIICLLMAFYALNLMPINYTGVALISVGIILMVAEAFVPSFGVLGIGGAASFIIGSIMLLDTDVPGYGISWLLISSLATISSGCLLVIVVLLRSSWSRPVATGPEQLIGKDGYVIEWNEATGQVKLQGEIWNARSEIPLESGSHVQVEGIDGLTLIVKEKH